VRELRRQLVRGALERDAIGVEGREGGLERAKPRDGGGGLLEGGESRLDLLDGGFSAQTDGGRSVSQSVRVRSAGLARPGELGLGLGMITGNARALSGALLPRRHDRLPGSERELRALDEGRERAAHVTAEDRDELVPPRLSCALEAREPMARLDDRAPKLTRRV